MTRRRELENHRRSLNEIRDIMNAMKNLAYMETRKISGFLDAQHSVVKHIETVAADFLGFYPGALAAVTNKSVEVHILIGAERGFCGDFNHALLRHFGAISKTQTNDTLRLISVGHKLETLLQEDLRTNIFIDGASVAEEVGRVLARIVNQLAVMQDQYDSLNLYALYHNDEHRLTHQQLLPPFRSLAHHQQQETHAPELNLQPEQFLLDLGYH